MSRRIARGVSALSADECDAHGSGHDARFPQLDSRRLDYRPLLDDRDAILFPETIGGKYALIHRPLEWVGPQYGSDQACAWISFADDLMGFPSASSRC